MSLNALADEIHATACSKGWHPHKRRWPELIALMHSELSEALEAYRNRTPNTCLLKGKPEGVDIELADCIIRILDACALYSIDIDYAVKIKMAYNKTRPLRHGGKRC